MTTLITGGAGFIGRRLIASLNRDGSDDLVVAEKLASLPSSPSWSSEVRARAWIDRSEVSDFLASRAGADVEAVVHLGATTVTYGSDPRSIMENNFRFTASLLAECHRMGVPFLYASSGAVYGRSEDSAELPRNECALSAYAYSKLLVDRLTRRLLANDRRAAVAGLRFFNVYGPGERHKGAMASVITQFADAVRMGVPMRVFGPSHGLGAGEHARDFVHVDDVVATIRWFAERPSVSGVYNCGTGTSASFNEVASLVATASGSGDIEYVSMPAALHASYQPSTRADLTRLRSTGCDVDFRTVATGIPETIDEGSGSTLRIFAGLPS